MGTECFFNDYLHFLIQVKAKALVSAEMKSIYHKRIEEDERLKFEVEEVFKEIQKYLHYSNILLFIYVILDKKLM